MSLTAALTVFVLPPLMPFGNGMKRPLVSGRIFQIDPVRIESLETFGTPEEVGARVLKVEQGKDGTLDTKLFDTRAEKQGDLSLYTLVRFCCSWGFDVCARGVGVVLCVLAQR